MSTEEVIKRLSPDKFFLKAFRFSPPSIISTIGQLGLLEMLMVDLTTYVLGVNGYAGGHMFTGL